MPGQGPLGPPIHSFFLDHLVTVKGLRPASVRSYRDTIRLLLCFVAKDKGTKITKLNLEDLSLVIFVPLSFATKHSRRSEEHTSELQSHLNLVCRLLLEKK